MGRLFVEVRDVPSNKPYCLAGHSYDQPWKYAEDDSKPRYVCAECSCDVASTSALVWEGYMGHQKPALLLRATVNVEQWGDNREEVLSTGRYTLVDVQCRCCHTALGWRYLEAGNPDQKYKEGSTLVEVSQLAVAEPRDMQYELRRRGTTNTTTPAAAAAAATTTPVNDTAPQSDSDMDMDDLEAAAEAAVAAGHAVAAAMAGGPPALLWHPLGTLSGFRRGGLSASGMSHEERRLLNRPRQQLDWLRWHRQQQERQRQQHQQHQQHQQEGERGWVRSIRPRGS